MKTQFMVNDFLTPTLFSRYLQLSSLRFNHQRAVSVSMAERTISESV